MDEKKDFDLLRQNELLINGLKEENNSLKMKIRNLEQSFQSKIESLKKIISGQNTIIEGLKKTINGQNNTISGLFTMNEELKKQLNLNDN